MRVKVGAHVGQDMWPIAESSRAKPASAGQIERDHCSVGRTGVDGAAICGYGDVGDVTLNDRLRSAADAVVEESTRR